MNRALARWAIIATVGSGLICSTQQASRASKSSNDKHVQSPFVISLVPTTSFDEPFGRVISIAKTSPRFFYVVLTNVSNEPQKAFESWNSWGSQAISFDVQTRDGKKFSITRKAQNFTRNFPSTFIIPPGEHMVYPISLDEEWDAVTTLHMADETPIPIAITANYEVRPTPEAGKEKVWTGRLESKRYQFKFRHW